MNKAKLPVHACNEPWNAQTTSWAHTPKGLVSVTFRAPWNHYKGLELLLITYKEVKGLELLPHK